MLTNGPQCIVQPGPRVHARLLALFSGEERSQNARYGKDVQSQSQRLRFKSGHCPSVLLIAAHKGKADQPGGTFETRSWPLAAWRTYLSAAMQGGRPEARSWSADPAFTQRADPCRMAGREISMPPPGTAVTDSASAAPKQINPICAGLVPVGRVAVNRSGPSHG